MGTYYWALLSLGWPWGAALIPFRHAPPAPSTRAPTRAPPWPASGLIVLQDDFLIYTWDFLTKQLVVQIIPTSSG